MHVSVKDQKSCPFYDLKIQLPFNLSLGGIYIKFFYERIGAKSSTVFIT